MQPITLSANKNWKFFRGQPPKGFYDNKENYHNKGLDCFEMAYDVSAWETVQLPHTVRVEKLLCSGGKNYQGECWYRKTFTVKEEWQDKELFFEFDGAMQRVDAWLDGKSLGYSVGGFLPFRLNVSGLAAGNHVLVLRVDNSDMPDVPPGKPQGGLDFCYFGGIYRNARFIVKNKIRITSAVHEGRPAAGGLFIRSFVNGDKAEVRVRVSVANGETMPAETQVKLYVNGEERASGALSIPAKGETDGDYTFIVENPKLWSPDTPTLYTLCAKVYRGEELLDEQTERFGIRTLVFKPDGVFLNGKRLFLNGSNRHQEYPYVGFAMTDAVQKRDLQMLKETGIVCIRTAHYPMDKVFMDTCDELGFLCVIPTPGWQVNPNSVLFDERSYENTRRMMRLHRNRPSAMLWEPILNETDFPAYFAEKQLEIVREEGGDTVQYCACDSCSRGADLFPVNYRSGRFSRKHDGQTSFVRECGDHFMEQYGPMPCVYRVRRGEHTDFYPGGEELMIRNARQRFESLAAKINDPVLSGCWLWCAFDNNRGYELNEGAWGMADFLRIPKFYYHLLSAQADPKKSGVKCFIANYWTENSPTDVSVYTNAQAVRLLVNGKEIGVKAMVKDGAANPPVVFENVAFEEGTLRAEALMDGKVATVYEISTPKGAYAIRLTPHYCGMEQWMADGNDLLLVHAEIVDENGTVVPTAEPKVRFTVSPNAEIVGARETWVKADEITAEAGVTGVLLRAGMQAGEVVLTAESEGLQSAKITLCMQPDTKEYLEGEAYSQPENMPTYACDEQEFFSVCESLKYREANYWNMAMSKPATASSCQDGYGAENANRKDFGDPWIAKEAALPQWWSCDMQQDCMLSGVTVSWEKDWLWYDYEIQTSLDGETWETAYAGKASGQTRLPNRFANPVKARYLRIVILSVSGGDIPGIYHVEVFGKKA